MATQRRRGGEHEDKGDDEGDQQAQEVEPGLLLLAAAQLAHGGARRVQTKKTIELSKGSAQELGGSKGGCCFFLLGLGMRAPSLSAVMNDPWLGRPLSRAEKQVVVEASLSFFLRYGGTNSRIILYLHW
jgi:hypothetical protein